MNQHFDESVETYEEMYPVIPLARLAELTRELNKSDFLGLFTVAQRVNELPHLNRCLSVSLFCQKADNKFPHEYGVIDFRDRELPWYSKYFESLLRLVRDFDRDAEFTEWKLRVYLERQLESLVPELTKVSARVEVYVMGCDSVGAQPGMMWRYLAFDDKSLEVAFVMDIDDSLASRKRFIRAFGESKKHFGRYMQHPGTGLVIAISAGGNEAMTYTPVLGSMIGLRPTLSDICIRDLIVDYMTWRKHRAETSNHPNRDFDTDRDTSYNAPIGAHCYGWGAHWFMYGFDENFVRRTVFPHFVKRGEVQTWVEFDLNGLLELPTAYPCRLDFEFCREYGGNEFWCFNDGKAHRVDVVQAKRPERKWSADDLAVVFLTCPREPSYFAQTLASFFAGNADWHRLREVVVVVDSPDLQCVEWLTHHAGIRFISRSQLESDEIQGFHIHRRACAAYWRAMGAPSPGAKAVLVCEDDVIFCDGWLTKLIESLDEMKDAGVTDYILSVYSPYDHEQWRIGRAYSSYPAGAFYGTQAVLYTQGELEPVREIIREHGVRLSEAPYDLLMKRRAGAQQNLYTTRNSLVQHIGIKTTGLGGRHHSSPSFRRKWPDGCPRLGDHCKPWMEDGEIALADRWLSGRNRILEYGAGGSTVRWAAGRDWHFVEHEQLWYGLVCEELRHRGIAFRGALVGKLQGACVCYSGEYPKGYLEEWASYVHAVERWGGAFDAVMIDGRARLACARLAVRKFLAADGVILWHDFGADGRKRYEAILAECELVEKVGTLAVLRPLPEPAADVGIVMTVVEPPEKVAWALRHFRAVYPNAPATVISDGVDNDEYAVVSAKFGATYIRGERLKVIEAGALWWQRVFEAGLSLGTRHILKVDPDTRFNRPARDWPTEDCFGHHIGRPGIVGEHIQGGVQGFQRIAVERIVNSGICKKADFKNVAYWAFTAGECTHFEKERYLSTDRLIMRILNELGMSRCHWREVVSNWGPAPADAERYAISHAHK